MNIVHDNAAFLRWWENEGSGMPPLPNEDGEEHARRVTQIAWLNGAYCARAALAQPELAKADVRSYLIPVETTYGTPPANPDDEMTIRNVSLGYWTAGLGEPWPDDSESPNEAAHLARELREIADCCDIASGLESAVPALTSAADLLERLAQPTCLVLKPSPELVQQFQAALPTQPGLVIACDQELATPTDKEIDDWWDERCELTRLDKADDFWSFDVQRSDLHKIVRAALTRWGRPAIKPVPADELLAAYRAGAADSTPQPTPQPIPVSERLPGPGDCAPWPDEPGANHWCWLGQKDEGGWHWAQASAMGMDADQLEWSLAGGGWTHWLPHWALPLPGASGG